MSRRMPISGATRWGWYPSDARRSARLTFLGRRTREDRWRAARRREAALEDGAYRLPTAHPRARAAAKSRLEGAARVTAAQDLVHERAASRGSAAGSREFVLHRARGRLDRLLDFGHLTTHVLAEYLDEHANGRVRAGVDVLAYASRRALEPNELVLPRRAHVRREPMSNCDRFTTAHQPCSRHRARPSRRPRVRASSMRSSLVSTPMRALERRVDFSRDARRRSSRCRRWRDLRRR